MKDSQRKDSQRKDSQRKDSQQSGGALEDLAGATHAGYLQRSLHEAAQGARTGQGGPFAAMVVEGARVWSVACNQVTSTGDPTAHAEVQAIRVACKARGGFQLDGCVLYASCEPCPMCLGAIYWARLAAVYYAFTRDDAAAAGFDDAHILQQVAVSPERRQIPFVHLPPAPARAPGPPPAVNPFDIWRDLPGRVDY